MKNIFSLTALAGLLLFFTNLNANELDYDTSSFEQQRSLVNQLLENRKTMFSQYEESLEMNTGIFGWFKTTVDLQYSNDILKDIIKHDNTILIETRKLIDLKDNEKIRFQELATQYDKQITAYMKTISKLQVENENLRVKIEQEKKANQQHNIMIYGLSLLLILALFILYKLFSNSKTQILTKV